MKLAWLSWYITVVFALLCLGSLMITTAGARFYEDIVSAVSAGLTLVGIVTSMSLGWLPREHWVNESRKLRVAFISVAVVATLLLVTCVG